MKVACVKDEKIIINEALKPNLKNLGFGAILKTYGCGLCGSDLVKLRDKLVKNGTVLGHEVVGEIVEINTMTEFKVGDKIACAHHVPCFKCVYCKNENYSMCDHFKKTNIKPGGFSEYIYLSEEHLEHLAVKIPPHLSEIEASFYEPLGCCVRAVKRANLKVADKALVIGLGSIGNLMGQALMAQGVEVWACDINEKRLDLGAECGFQVFNSMNKEILPHPDSDFLGVDAVFMTSGADVTIELALKSVRNGGKIIVFASTPKNLGYANNEIYYRELTVMGSYSPSPNDLMDSMELLETGKVKVDKLSTIYEFDKIEDAFRDTIESKIFKAYVNIKGTRAKQMRTDEI